MSWLSLMAQLGININPYIQGLHQARREAGRFGDHVGRDIKTRMFRYFSAGAVGLGIKRLVTASIEQARQVTQQHLQSGKSVQEVQAIMYAANQTGQSFEEIDKILSGTSEALPEMKARVKELVDEFNRLGSSMDEDTVQSLNKVAGEWDLLMLKMRADAAKPLALGWDMAKLFWKTSPYKLWKNWIVSGINPIDTTAQALAETTSRPGDRVIRPDRRPGDRTISFDPKEQRERLSLLNLGAARLELAKLSKVGSLSTSDALAQVGGFIGRAGAAPRPEVDLAREQVNLTRQLVSNTDPTKNRRYSEFSFK
jgi:hypothetical protein